MRSPPALAMMLFLCLLAGWFVGCSTPESEKQGIDGPEFVAGDEEDDSGEDENTDTDSNEFSLLHFDGLEVTELYLISCGGDQLVEVEEDGAISSWACYCEPGDLAFTGGVASGHINRYVAQSRPTSDGEGWLGHCRRRTGSSGSHDCSGVYATCAMVEGL